MLCSRLEEDLLAHANAQCGLVLLVACAHNVVATHAFERIHDGTEGSNAWDQQSICVQRGVTITGERDLRTGGLERANRGSDVSRPVVQHHDLRHWRLANNALMR